MSEAKTGQVGAADPFYEHLDACEQCRDQPFNLCAAGDKALRDSMAKLNKALGVMEKDFRR